MLIEPPQFSAVVAAFAAGVSAFGALVALLSLLLSRKNWLEANRPIVTAYVDHEGSAGGITIFNLYLRNSGSRPATSVQLVAQSSDIHQLLEEEVDTDRKKDIEGVFSHESRVSILHHGETLVTSFGLATEDSSQRWLKYGQEIHVEIRYADLEGRKYKSLVPLRLRPREGFGGGVWTSEA